MPADSATPRDLWAVIRSGRYAFAAGPVLRYAVHGARVATTSFRRDVAPMIADAYPDPATRDAVHDVLLATSLKVGFLLSCYATAAGRPFRVDLAVLGGAFTRLYDDLIDRPDTDAATLHRLRDLFDGRRVDPPTPSERLLTALYADIDRRLARPRPDPIHAATAALHRGQELSTAQKAGTVPDELIDAATVAKGGWALVVLFMLIHPAMTDRERDLVHELGVVLQLLDDHFDIHVDRAAGIATTATRATTTLAGIVDRFEALRPRLVTVYGRRGARHLHATLAAMFATAFVARLGAHRRPSAVPRGPLAILLRRTNGAGLSP